MNLFGPKLADGARFDIDGHAVRLSVSRRARRISLRVDPRRHEIVAIAPTEKRLSEALAFARQRRAWIAERLACMPVAPSMSSGDTLTILGEAFILLPDGRRPQFLGPSVAAPARLAGCGNGQVDPDLVTRAVKQRALGVFRARAGDHCRTLGVTTPPIAIADARTRWGSCSPARHDRPASIRLSWRLALGPFAVADYVVAHECAHLIEANHGPRFWELVQRLVGDASPHRAWLKANGATLHAFGGR